MSKFIRARDAEQKADRRDTILQAAAELLDQLGHLPTAAQVAAKTGLSKGTIYLYFRTKEEIYLALLQDSFVDFLNQLRDQLKPFEQLNGSIIAEQLLRTLLDRKAFLPLASVAQSILEQNASENALTAYKQALAKALMDCVQVITERSHFDHDQATQLMLCSYGQIFGLWQISNPPQNVRCIIENAGLSFLDPEFWREVKFALPRLWGD